MYTYTYKKEKEPLPKAFWWILAAITVIAAAVFIYVKIIPPSGEPSNGEKENLTEKEMLIKEQSDKLNELRAATNSTSTAQEAQEIIENQEEQLDALRKQTSPQPLNKQGVEEQLEELDKLRLKAQ